MSTTATAENRAQFSVIARLSPGTDSSLSVYGIITEIQNHLKPYKCICNIAFSAPNFIIHLPSLELQLQILAMKAFAGPDYTLDILPWCSEYVSYDLPWIITAHGKGADSPKQTFESSTDNLSAHSAISQHCDQGDTNKMYIALSQKLMDSLGPVDYSYLMITETKELYQAKSEAFQVCEQTCREICSIVHQFSAQIDGAIDSVYQEAIRCSRQVPQNMSHHIEAFAGELKHQMWFIAEEAYGLRVSLQPAHNNSRELLNLHGYSKHNTDGQVITPLSVASTLKQLADTAVDQIYSTSLLTHTEIGPDGKVETQLWCAAFHHMYKSAAVISEAEAEANAIYRFLKHINNILGYTILDRNSDMLTNIVCTLNYFNRSMPELQCYVNGSTAIIQESSQAIQTMYHNMKSKMQNVNILHLTTAADELILLLQHYTEAIRNGIQRFETSKRTFRGIKLASLYKAKSD